MLQRHQVSTILYNIPKGCWTCRISFSVKKKKNPLTATVFHRTTTSRKKQTVTETRERRPRERSFVLCPAWEHPRPLALSCSARVLTEKERTGRGSGGGGWRRVAGGGGGGRGGGGRGGGAGDAVAWLDVTGTQVEGRLSRGDTSASIHLGSETFYANWQSVAHASPRPGGNRTRPLSAWHPLKSRAGRRSAGPLCIQPADERLARLSAHWRSLYYGNVTMTFHFFVVFK